MKNLMKISVLGLLVVFLFTSCAKQPTQQIDEAKAAIDAVVKAGGDIYAKDELKRLNDDYNAAMDEVNAQSKKLFKKFGKAKEMLAKIKTDADGVAQLIPARKEEAKNNAINALNEAKAAFDAAKALLDKAPKGKGTKADIEAMKSDLAGLEAQLAEVQASIDQEDYLGAYDKAASIKEKANAISEQVNAAIEKIRGR
ncbi:MAG TPA: hypothetical protein PLP57_07240 [Candidatus Saccharicenans sp.]|jgi:chromosome segregation ATPase|nr:hypothetical protein [Candidatus Saccharicenans sp.]HRD02420.1 hypothetical protein [Candidatus Saccharicenans sp.]